MICDARAGRRRKRSRSQTGAAAQPSISRCQTARTGGPSCRSGSRRRRPAHCAAGSPPCRTGQPTRSATMSGPAADEHAAGAAPDLPRVVVARIEGRDTLYEFDLTATPSRAWRAVFLRPPPALTTADHTPDIGRVAVLGHTVHFRAAPQHATTGCVELTSGSPRVRPHIAGLAQSHRPSRRSMGWTHQLVGPTFRRPSKRSLKYRRGRPGPHDRDCPGRNAGPPTGTP